ncbi:pregnancy-specific glycoprotein 22 isoform X2 [Danio rerio]|uniref:Pregnancy-specific glycoprotein 22 isoform X2 n=2 Tax=Danio rerio TaxID=7955 RepID=A0AC58H964_DANRE
MEMIREMLLISALMLLQMAAGVERVCRFNQADPCYAALGDKLSLQLVSNTRHQELHLYKKFNNHNKQIILSVANNNETKHDYIRNRCEFILDNGTLIINTVTRADFGVYLLKHYFRGRTASKDLQVNVEGVEQICWFDQPDPCYAALGHKLYLPMVQDTRDLHLRLYKDFYSPSSITVFEVNVNKETKDESIRSRSEFFYENGTLIITHMSRADSGTYELHHTVSGTVYDSRLRVEVEAPIGSVQVYVNCSSSHTHKSLCVTPCTSDSFMIHDS